MSQAQQAATAAALTYLGYTVKAAERGRARLRHRRRARRPSHVLKVAQVITAVNGTLTPDGVRAGQRAARADSRAPRPTSRWRSRASTIPARS